MAENDKSGFKSADGNFSIPLGPRGKLDPKKLLGGMSKDVRRRWLIVGAVGVVSMSTLGTWLSSAANPTKARVEAPSSVIDTTPKGLSGKNDWKSQTGADMIALKQSLSEQAAAQKELIARMDLMRQELVQAKNAPSATSAPKAAASSFDQLTMPPPPEPPKSLGIAPKLDVPAGGGSAPAGVGSNALGDQVAAAAPVTRTAARSFVPALTEEELIARQHETVVDEMVANDRVGYLPAGSFANATLISGVEAFTGGTAQAAPQPVVLRLDENAVLPNAARYQIKGCHVLMSMWGDMSSERVFGRTSTLTCVDAQNRLVLSEEVEGVVVDSDGKNGVRGTLQDRQGAKLARSLLAGLAQGMASALGSAQSTVTSSALGSVSTVSGSKALQSAGYGGANSSAQMLSQFYLKQAEATMPVISVDAGRKVSILFTKSKALRFETVGAYKDKPQQTIKVERE